MADYDRAIPPGGVGKITLQVKTKGYQGETTKSARVYSNDPNQHDARIYLSINVRPHIIVEPAPRILLRGVVGEDLRRVVQIRSADDQPLEITGVETNLGSVIDYTLNRKEDGHGYELEVAVKSTDTQVYSGFIKLSTNHPVKKELKLPVLVRVNPELEVRPAVITFRKTSKAGSKGRQFKRMLTVVNNRGKPFQVRGLRYNKEYFEVRPLGAADKPSSNHRFEVILLLERLPVEKAGLQDSLIIETDVPQAAELKVPMKIQVDPAKAK